MSIKIDENNLKSGLLGLVVSLVEIIEEVLELEALRRIESGQLKEEEINRLGKGLMELDQALERIKVDNHIEDLVDEIRSNLDMVVEDTLEIISNPEDGENARVS